jgi:hypothetical protein
MFGAAYFVEGTLSLDREQRGWGESLVVHIRGDFLFVHGKHALADRGTLKVAGAAAICTVTAAAT